MGRHRNDPRGTNRVLIAVFAIVLLVVLVTAGGFALYGALENDPQPATASASFASPTAAAPI